MITRDFGHGGYAAGCGNSPPPLHVYDTESEHANWHPLPRVALFPHHPGPVLVGIPAPGGFAGDDPTDPSQQTAPRVASVGILARLHQKGVGHS